MESITTEKPQYEKTIFPEILLERERKKKIIMRKYLRLIINQGHYSLFLVLISSEKQLKNPRKSLRKQK